MDDNESFKDYMARETARLTGEHFRRGYGGDATNTANPIHWPSAASGSYVSLHTANPQKKENPVKTNVQEVRVKAGWVGQVVLGAEFTEPDIVWESVPKKKRHKARELAVAHLAEVFA